MYLNSDVAATARNKGIYIINSQENLKTEPQPSNNNPENHKNSDGNKKSRIAIWCDKAAPSIIHYVVLFTLGLLTWGILWSTWSHAWSLDGPWFRLALIAGTAWGSGLIFHSLTTLPPVLAGLIIGILAGNLGYIDMRHYPEIDMFLRKIYPVIILGKGALQWDFNFMKKNWQQIASLGILPWTAEVVTMAICMFIFLGHPWLWGISFGALFASVSCPVIMPNVAKFTKDCSRNWVRLFISAGGIDVALSVAVYGMTRNFMDPEVDQTFRYIKLTLTPVVGALAGAAWGVAAGFLPHPRDPYVTPLRIIFVLLGGLFANFFALHFRWAGTAGIAVLVCNSLAARRWVRRGWPAGDNPAVSAYRVLWALCEPALFAYTGTFFVISNVTPMLMLNGLIILAICLTVRLFVTAIVCRNMTIKEKIFVCCCWSPKTIVQAVLCPMAISNINISGDTQEHRQFAEENLAIAIQAILIMTPISFLVTKYLGPILIKNKRKEEEGNAGV